MVRPTPLRIYASAAAIPRNAEDRNSGTLPPSMLLLTGAALLQGDREASETRTKGLSDRIRQWRSRSAVVPPALKALAVDVGTEQPADYISWRTGRHESVCNRTGAD